MPNCSSVGVSQSQTPWEAGPSLHTLPAPGDDPGSNPFANPLLFLKAERSRDPQHQPRRPLPTCKTSPRKKHRGGGGRMEEPPRRQQGNKAHPVCACLLTGN